MAPTAIPEYKGPIYSATYSGVPVFEFLVDDNQIMRRRSDDWINATHILKVADFDKPARTRILEREVQKGVHEKIQGGYGKYQGTWVPLHDGRLLAERNGVLDKLRPIFDFVHKDRDKSPPQAPKHTTAASNKPRIPKAAAVRRAPKAKPLPALRNDDHYENLSSQLNDDETPDNSTVVSESMIDDDDMAYRGQNTGSRKRKRAAEGEMSKSEEEHRKYADALLDYFMLHGHDEETSFVLHHAPIPPVNFQVNRAIDTQGHTALHWAAAMGEIDVVKDLIRRGADLEVRNIRGETPLIRAALFANCFEKGCMPKMIQLLQSTLKIVDDFNGSVLHHVAHTAHSCSKTKRAQHYLKILLNKLNEISDPRAFQKFLSIQDTHGDTAFHIAARNSRRCTRVFQGVGAPSDIPNHNNETVDQYLQRRMKSYNKADNYQTSSSPPQPDSLFFNGRDPGGEPPSSQQTNLISLPAENLHTQSARSFSESINTILSQRATEIVQAVESEMQEKEDALNEGTRLLRNVTSERENVHQQTLALASEARDDDIMVMREELASLRKYAEAIEEQSQHATLHALVRGEENEAVTLTNQSNGKSANEDDLVARIEAAKLLHAEQVTRRELVGEIVRGKGDAGISEKGEMLMRLVSGSLGVEERDLLSLLPEMVEELENAGAGAGPLAGEDEAIAID